MLLNHPAPIELRINRIERTVRPNKAFKHGLPVSIAAGEDFPAPAFVRVARDICPAEDVLFSGVQCQKRSKGIHRQLIVRVEKRKPFAFCRRNARVPRPRYAAVFLMKDTNPFIRLRPCVQCRARSVIRAIVHREKFPIRNRLCTQASDSTVKRLFAVVARHHHRNHCGFSLPARSANAASPHFLCRICPTAISG